MEERVKELEAIIEERTEQLKSILIICQFYMKETERLKEILWEKIMKEIKTDIMKSK